MSEEITFNSLNVNENLILKLTENKIVKPTAVQAQTFYFPGKIPSFSE